MSDEEYEAARREIEDLSGELSERRKEADHLMDRVGQLRELLAVKNEETLPVGGSMLHGVDLLDHPICRMVPSGGIRVNKKPQFIEVDSEGYLVHPAKERFFLTDLPGMDADMRPGHQPVTRMENLIHNAYEKRDQEYLIFLVRPSGATAFRIVLRYLRLKYPHAQWPGALSQIDVGWEPFAKEWLLLDEQTATRP